MKTPVTNKVRRSGAWWRRAAAWGWAAVMAGGGATGAARAAEAAFLRGEFVAPFENLHNHGSCVVELPNGDLIVCWFRGSGERTADDCAIVGARLAKGATRWSERFTMADTPGFPDTNCCMFVDPRGRLWLLWPTIQDNHWESALMKYRIADDYAGPGAPRWSTQEVLHVKPGPEFVATIARDIEKFRAQAATEPKVKAFIDYALAAAQDKLKSRLGWMTRAHPFVLDGRRLLVPLYSDGFNFSLMAITDDWGATWRTSAPLVGEGNVQPSIVRRRDGTLYTLMRDNGLPPQRAQQATSRDGGETWSEVTDSDLVDPGAGLEILALRDGSWVAIHNDAEKGRHSLAVTLSDDEGKTWKWKRHLERDEPGPDAGRYGYPSIIQAQDGTLHATYSVQLRPSLARPDAAGKPAHKAIRHVQFTAAWIRGGAP
jgi:predicted neuraminidase